MKKVHFSLDLEEEVVGDVVFVDQHNERKRAQIQSDHNVNSSTFAKSWNLSSTGSFESKGLKIKNGIQSSPPYNFAAHDHNNNNDNDNNGNNEFATLSMHDLEFVGNLGNGSVGTVKKAMHKQSGEVLAIKCIDFADRASRKQFVDEISLYLKLRHPCIVSFKGCCINVDTEQLYLALEYCSNGSLASYVASENGGLFTEEQCKRLSFSVISALSYFQFHKVIHRDIKPENILLDEQLNAKLVDFGIQKDLLKQTQTFASTQIGTMIYMSPERMNGHKYSYKSDVWSFGLTLLFCVYGCFPYTRQNQQKMSLLDMHIAIVEDEVPALPETDKNGKMFSIQFQSFIKACLYKDEQKRWTAADLLMHPFLAE